MRWWLALGGVGNVELLHALELALQADYSIAIFPEPRSCVASFYRCMGFDPELILADYEMPGMTGLEMLDEILRKNPGIKAYLMSSVLNDAIINGARRIGLKGWIMKPFGLEQIKSLLTA